MRTAIFVFTAAALVGGCQQDKDDPAWSKDQGGATAAPAAAGGRASGDVEARLAKLEARIERMADALRPHIRPSLDPKPTYAVPVDKHDPIIGAKDAKVTIIEAYEFLCPYCAMVAPTVDQLLKEYPNDVRVVPKVLLIHGAPAVPSSLAMCAAQKQGKAAEMQKALWDTIWADPNKPDHAKATAEGVVATAASIGLDQAKFKADLEGTDCRTWLQESGETLQKFGTNSTPSFYVNGKFIQERDPAVFKKMIEAEIKAVNASGIPAAEYYDKVVVGKGAKEAVIISPLD